MLLGRRSKGIHLTVRLLLGAWYGGRRGIVSATLKVGGRSRCISRSACGVGLVQ